MEEKNEIISKVLQELIGQKVWLVYKHDSDLVGEYVVIGKTQAERCNIWFAGGGKSVNAFDKEEYSEPCLVDSNIYIGNIVAITRTNVDLYRRDIPEDIFFEDKGMFTESKGKTH